MGDADANTLRGYRSIGDVTFDLDGALFSDIGWVIFEVSDSQPNRGQGVIGTFNNYATLTLVRFRHTQKPCQIQGVFDDGETGEHVWQLDDVVFTGVLFRDVNGLIGFRAGKCQPH
ncbi:MAG: hypothetical protein ACXVIG_07500 [Halobacteriota archaeon]